MTTIKLSISGLHSVINNKPANLNVWILSSYNSKKEVRTFKEFYTAIMFTFANINK